MSETLICPNCKASLPINTSICEWCSTVVNQEGEKSIENISADLEDIIRTMRSIEHPGLFSSFKKNSKISMPIFTIAFFILAYKLSAWFSILALGFLMNALLSIFRKSSNPIASLKPLKAEFDDKVRNFQSLYGANNKFKTQIQNYQNEWKTIENEAIKGRRFEWISYGVIATIFAISLLIPEPKTPQEIESELRKMENATYNKIDSLLKVNNTDGAKKELVNIKSKNGLIVQKSEIQYKELELQLFQIENQLISGDITGAKNKLSTVKWTKNSVDYDEENLEEEVYRKFVQKKSEVNQQLPPDQRIEIESEIDF